MNDADLRQLKMYTWEFLRRNPRYKKEFMSLKEKLGMNPSEYDRVYYPVWLSLRGNPLKKVEYENPGVDINKVKEDFIKIGRFKEKWQVTQAIDPKEKNGPDFFLGVGMDAAHASAKSIVEVEGPSMEDQDYRSDLPPNILRLKVNLLAPTREIMKQIEDTLEVYKKISAEKQFPDLKDPRWAQYDECLRIYDLVEIGKKTIEESACEIFPGFNEAPHEEKKRTLEKMTASLKEAKRLVDFAPEFNMIET